MQFQIVHFLKNIDTQAVHLRHKLETEVISMNDERRPPRPPFPPPGHHPPGPPGPAQPQPEWDINNAPLTGSISHNLIVQLLPAIDEAQRLCRSGQSQPALQQPCSRIRTQLEAVERQLRSALPGTQRDRSNRCRLNDFQQRMDDLTRQLALSLDRQPPEETPCGVLLPLQALLAHSRRVCSMGAFFPLTPGLRQALPRILFLLRQSAQTAANAARRLRCIE